MTDISRRVALLAVAAGAVSGSAAAVSEQESTQDKKKGRRQRVPGKFSADAKQGAPPEKVPEVERAAPMAKEQKMKGDSAAAPEMLLKSFKVSRIGANFSIAADRLYGYPYLRCDVLLAEAIGFASRCLKTRIEYDALFQANFEFLFDIDRFNAFDAILLQEEANGLYGLDAQISQADLNGALALLGPITTAAMTIANLESTFESQFNEQYGWIQLVAWLSHISGYQHGAADNTVTWNKVEDTVIDYCQKAAESQGNFQLSAAISQLRADQNMKQAQVANLNARLPGLAAKASWEQKATMFKALRAQVMRQLYTQRNAALGASDGPLNFTERLGYMNERFNSDMREAISRVPAIAEGYAKLFGYSSPIPGPIQQLISNPGQTVPSSHLLDQLVAWLRDITDWGTRFASREQASSARVSLKYAVGTDAWSSFKNTGTLAFDLDEGVFPGQYHTRLRGLSLYAEGEHAQYSARIRTPRIGRVRHLSGNWEELNQKLVDPIRIGRVESSKSLRPPERVGLNAAYNASPIGKWEVSLSERSSGHTGWSGISDLTLELVLVEQSR
jgi:hypothetical protein